MSGFHLGNLLHPPRRALPPVLPSFSSSIYLLLSSKVMRDSFAHFRRRSRVFGAPPSAAAPALLTLT